MIYHPTYTMPEQKLSGLTMINLDEQKNKKEQDEWK